MLQFVQGETAPVSWGGWISNSRELIMRWNDGASIGGGAATRPAPRHIKQRFTDNFGTIAGDPQPGCDNAGTITDDTRTRRWAAVWRTRLPRNATVAGGEAETRGGAKAKVGGGFPNAVTTRLRDGGRTATPTRRGAKATVSVLFRRQDKTEATSAPATGRRGRGSPGSVRRGQNARG